MGLSPNEVLDFSVGVNPFGPPSGVKKIFNTIAIDGYPDSEATELRQCLAEKLGVVAGKILVGSGAMELIRLIALTYFGHGKRVLIMEPTFGEYEVACKLVGTEVVKQRAREKDNLKLRVEETISLIRQYHPRGVFICNPNNPTGQYLTRQEVEIILAACIDCLLILDEAYIAFVDQSWSSVDLISRGNVIIVRSMTKDYSLAGLRLGYALANEQIIEALRRVCPPWNVNVVAQQAGVIALRDGDYSERCQRKIGQAKQFFIDELQRLSLTVLPSKTNFFLVKVGDGQALRTALLRHGILVRDCASFGLPEYVRLAARTIPDCRKFITTIQKLKQTGELKTNI